MRTWRTTSAALATLAVMTRGAVAAQPAMADSPLAEWSAAFQTVPVSTGGQLVSGTATNGSTVEAGDTVVLFISNADGDTTADVALSRTTSNSSGAWSLAVPSTTDVSPYVNASGHVNFMVEAFGATGGASYFFSALVSPGGSAAPTDNDQLVGGQAKQGSNVATFVVDATAARAVGLDTTQVPLTSQASAQPSSPSDPPGHCYDTVLKTWYNQKTVIGYTADEATGTAEHFVYATNASTNLGVGIKVGNVFKLSGSESRSNTVTADFPATHDVAYTNYYSYSNYEYVQRYCFTPHEGFLSYLARPKVMTGSFTYGPAPRIEMGYCVKEGKGLTITKQTTAAYTVGAGVDISGSIGIDLSAESGYSSTVEIAYAFNGNGHPWCGLKDYPASGTSGLQTIHASITS